MGVSPRKRCEGGVQPKFRLRSTLLRRRPAASGLMAAPSPPMGTAVRRNQMGGDLPSQHPIRLIKFPLAGLVPAIHVSKPLCTAREGVDGRDKPGQGVSVDLRCDLAGLKRATIGL